MRKLNNKGFTALEALLIVIIFAIIGGIGYYVMQANNKSNDNLNAANKASQTKVAKTNSLKTTYSRLPVDLQAAVLAEYKVKVPGCVKDNKLVDENGKPFNPLNVAYDKTGFATVGIGCDGGSNGLFVKTDGKWQDVENTQLAWSCDTLKRFKVPAKLIQAYGSGNCLKSPGPKIEIIPYTGP